LIGIKFENEKLLTDGAKWNKDATHIKL